MSDSGSSSESEALVHQPKRTNAKASKKQKMGNSKSVTTPHGKNEGTDPSHEYQPPPGAVQMDHLVDSGFGDFDWDALKDNEELELWVVRVPQGLKPKHLENIKLDSPSSSQTSRIGSIDRKHASFEVWSLGDSPSDHVGGEELKRLSCVLPRKSKGGKLYQAPKPIARHIVVTAKPEVPTPAADSEVVFNNPPRPQYPLEVLKHCFMPLGALAPTGAPSTVDVDSALVPIDASQTTDAPPKRKRKGDGETKKSKNKAVDGIG
ncbi:hypothetical protein DAEQUDRAFT_285788 [Daedalea quercina L-15889]|uniref:Uncharacterized protein n=1 Tax=Daedalea quercina L-15889 TaxID=1314783 RepID=A0A165TVW6_9APHY|nr:hypothetical protein DAEQUDRAFT_285788 [Daedalea quercina L-15889]